MSSFVTRSGNPLKGLLCVYCKGESYSSSCEEVSEVQSRRDIVRRDHRCWMCMSVSESGSTQHPLLHQRFSLTRAVLLLENPESSPAQRGSAQSSTECKCSAQSGYDSQTEGHGELEILSFDSQSSRHTVTRLFSQGSC